MRSSPPPPPPESVPSEQARIAAFHAYLATGESPAPDAPPPPAVDAAVLRVPTTVPPFGDASTLAPQWHWLFTHDLDLDRTVERALLVKELTVLFALLALGLLRRMYL